MANTFKELFSLTLNRIAVSVWYVSSMPVVLHAGFNEENWRLTVFPKWNIDTSIQLQVLTLHPLTSQNMLQRYEQKAAINMLTRSKTLKTQ